jgi:hypothetical protein
MADPKDPNAQNREQATAHAKEQVKQSAEAKAKSVEEAYAHQGRPTPTQEENDLAALGVPFEQHEDDGSGPQPEFRMQVTRQSEAAKPSSGGYATRASTPKPATTT